jgi:hypothetical protein
MHVRWLLRNDMYRIGLTMGDAFSGPRSRGERELVAGRRKCCLEVGRKGSADTLDVASEILVQCLPQPGLAPRSTPIALCPNWSDPKAGRPDSMFFSVCISVDTTNYTVS